MYSFTVTQLAFVHIIKLISSSFYVDELKREPKH